MIKTLSFLVIILLSGAAIYSIRTTTHVEEKEAVELPPRDCGVHPTNVNWAELQAHYDSCTIYTTRREGHRTMSDFVRYIQHEDADTRTVRQVECRMAQTYYRRLKLCSQCHTTDCRDCDRMMETLQDAKQLVREKRFSLE